MSTTLLIIALVMLALFSGIWLWRRTHRYEWFFVLALLSLGASYLSSLIFRIDGYQAGCESTCGGWYGYPIATHIGFASLRPTFYPAGFLTNAIVYFGLLLVFGALLLWLADNWRWQERRRRWRILVAFITAILILAATPVVFPPPQPRLTGEPQRLAINAARAWRWQLQVRTLMQRRLAVEDVRLHPDGQQHRVCFRVYTWFYLPIERVYIDLEPAGVRATGGGVIPLSDSCWVQP